MYYDVTPSSSPLVGPVNSSPPSSPALLSFELDSPPRPDASFSHPFAASTKATKLPLHYEKKTNFYTPPCTPPGTFSRSACLTRGAPFSRSLVECDYLTDNGSSNGSPRTTDCEEHIWDEALRKPFDTGNGQIDLSNHRLTSIPASIRDLAGFFNTPEASEQTLFSGRVPLARINTEPAIVSARTRSFERTQSIKDYGKERHVLTLYLMGNKITSLPPELFLVKNLTVLSLRGNRLTFIPPDICLLTNLNELNISNNQLRFLPWQMGDMKIEKLLVNPNPFLPEPLHPSPTESSHVDHNLSPFVLGSPVRRRRSITRLHSLRKEALLGSGSIKPVLSPVKLQLTRVPPLMEFCYRILFAPSQTAMTPGAAPHLTQTVFSEYYALPLSDQWEIPPNVFKVFDRSVPGTIPLRSRLRLSPNTIWLEDLLSSSHTEASTSESVSTSLMQETGMGTCPNPAHKGRVFVRHASERYSWERRIAGADVGGAVPLRWRGCLETCLNFLDEDEASHGGPSAIPAPSLSPTWSRMGEDAYVGGDMELDVDTEEDVVMAVDLGTVELDMDDFDD